MSLAERRQAKILQHELAHELDDLFDGHPCIEARSERLGVRVILVLVGLADHANRIPSPKHCSSPGYQDRSRFGQAGPLSSGNRDHPGSGKRDRARSGKRDR